MKRWFKPVSLVALLMAFGCSGSAPTPAPQPIHPLEQNALNALRRAPSPETLAALDAALERYRTLDDIHGQWRVHMMTAKLALTIGDSERALREGMMLEKLASLLDRALVSYDTHLILGRLRNDPREFEAALRSARTPLEQAVVYTYLGRTSEAVALIAEDAADNPADRAFVFYQHATRTDSAELCARALLYYRLAEDTRGIADALVRLAQLARNQGHADSARTYAERAVRVLDAAGDQPRAEAVQSWLDQK